MDNNKKQICEAAQTGDAKKLQEFVEQGADVNALYDNDVRKKIELAN